MEVKSMIGKKAKLPPWAPDWKALTQGKKSDRGSSGGKQVKVLVANSLPCFPISTILESLVAAALRVRNADVHFLLCDGVLSACLNLKSGAIKDPAAIANESWKSHPSACNRCATNTPVFTDLDYVNHFYSDYLDEEDIAEIEKLSESLSSLEHKTYTEDGIAIGEHAYAGCLRYFAMGDLEGVPYADIVLKKYFQAALQTKRVVARLIEKERFDVAVFHHGIYIPQGIIGEVCRDMGVRVVNWNPAYRKRCFIFSHGDTYHHTLLDEPVSEWAEMPFGPRQGKEIMDYLQSRWTGKNDWIWFHDKPQYDDESLVKETGIDLDKPIIGMLTNVMWDAQLHYRANAFPDMLTWIKRTIEYFIERSDLQLLIRIHPAEISGTQPSKQLVAEEIAKYFPKLPGNIFVIPPDSNVGTYSAMAKANAVIIYGTKTGVELATMRKPVIVAGEAWIRNKGLSIDVSSEQQYREILDKLPLPDEWMTDEQLELAKKYAYHFFMRRMIEVDSVRPAEGKSPFVLDINSLEELEPGQDPGLDVICDGILNGEAFIHRKELA